MLGFYSTSDDEEMEDVSSEEVHTPFNPYCGDLNCWCHTNVSYHVEVTELPEVVDAATYATALNFSGI